MRLQKFVISALALLGISVLPSAAFAVTRLSVQVSTGVDDLRGGNTAFVNLILIDGRVLTEQVLTGSGLAGRSTRTISVIFPETVTATQIRSIRIRHDGSPRSGQPFDTYDNWDLRTLRVNIGEGSIAPFLLLYDSSRDSRPRVVSDGLNLLNRFTGESRQIELFIRAIAREPDFTIEAITPNDEGLSVLVRNIGLGSGRVSRVACTGGSTPSEVLPDAGRSSINAGAAQSFLIPGVPGTRNTCTVYGVDSIGAPEVVTANNVRTRP
ncbi:MAG: hypothetical protein ACKO24_18385 [Leptolyngbyaceae cyanobacterium]